MNYQNAIHCIDPESALNLIELPYERQGSYIYYSCPQCKGKAVIKAWGLKKNLTFCPNCKNKGHIISLVMAVKNTDYKDAVIILEKVYQKRERITKEISLNYELDYTKEMEEAGITQETAKRLEIGKPKGKTMLAGHLVFPVYWEEKKIAYFGIMRGKPKYHQSFNPELYLWGEMADEVILTDEMIECVLFLQEGKNAVCNFNLPYLSPEQAELLEGKKVELKISDKNKKEFSILSVDWNFYHKFI